MRSQERLQSNGGQVIASRRLDIGEDETSVQNGPGSTLKKSGVGILDDVADQSVWVCGVNNPESSCAYLFERRESCLSYVSHSKMIRSKAQQRKLRVLNILLGSL